MIVLGAVYFRKLIEVCDFAQLESYTELLGPFLSEATGTEYALSQAADSRQVARWSKGAFNQPGERALRFPRVVYVFRPACEGADERWRVTVFFTPIPHIKGSYTNKRTKHTISVPVEKALGSRLIEACLADTFDLRTNDTILGSEAGLYIHLKLLSIPLLRKRLESGKYKPPGSDLRELLQTVLAILPETGPSSTVTELQNTRSHQKNFLGKCDQRIIAALGKKKLEAILKATEVSADRWLSAGKRSLW